MNRGRRFKLRTIRLLSLGLFSIVILSACVSCDESVYHELFSETNMVTFDSQGGSPVDSQEVAIGGLAIQPADPVYAGRTFAGWFRESACINPWMFASDMVQADVTLYARWTINQFTLAYAAGANGSLTGTTMQTVNYGANGTAVTAVPAAGYSFTQWSDGSTVNPRTDTNVTGNINVTASFAINQYSVTYNSNGGTGTLPASSTNYNYGDLVNVLGNTGGLTRAGYIFGGWNTASDGSGTTYTTGDTITMGTGNITLYANWGPTVIAFTSNRDGNYEIYSMNADGTRQTRLTFNTATDGNPSWSPDRTRIVFTSDADGDNEICVLNSDGSITQLTNNTYDDSFPCWSPDGTRIAFQTNRNVSIDVYVMNTTGGGLINLTGSSDEDRDPCWSSDSTRIFFTTWVPPNPPNYYSEIFAMNSSDGNGRSNLTNWLSETDHQASSSPDGTRIAFVRMISTEYNILTMNVNGSNKQFIMSAASGSGIGHRNPCWSPDSTRIVFYSNQTGNNEIFTMNTDGSGLVQITSNSSDDIDPCW
jgi:uncharacterized repeat protein (TIGR02543 family)